MVTDSSTFLVLQTIVLNALGMESFKILGELEEPITRPELLITRNSDALTLSWVDPTRIFKLEDASTLGLGFFESGITPAYNGDTASVSFELDGLTGSRFFRLNTQPQPRPEE